MGKKKKKDKMLESQKQEEALKALNAALDKGDPELVEEALYHAASSHEVEFEEEDQDWIQKILNYQEEEVSEPPVSKPRYAYQTFGQPLEEDEPEEEDEDDEPIKPTITRPKSVFDIMNQLKAEGRLKEEEIEEIEEDDEEEEDVEWEEEEDDILRTLSRQISVIPNRFTGFSVITFTDTIRTFSIDTNCLPDDAYDVYLADSNPHEYYLGILDTIIEAILPCFLPNALLTIDESTEICDRIAAYDKYKFRFYYVPDTSYVSAYVMSDDSINALKETMDYCVDIGKPASFILEIIKLATANGFDFRQTAVPTIASYAIQPQNKENVQRLATIILEDDKTSIFKDADNDPVIEIHTYPVLDEDILSQLDKVANDVEEEEEEVTEEPPVVKETIIPPVILPEQKIEVEDKLMEDLTKTSLDDILKDAEDIASRIVETKEEVVVEEDLLEEDDFDDLLEDVEDTPVVEEPRETIVMNSKKEEPKKEEPKEDDSQFIFTPVRRPNRI